MYAALQYITKTTNNKTYLVFLLKVLFISYLPCWLNFRRECERAYVDDSHSRLEFNQQAKYEI